jgi:hypothetical protein
MSNASASLSRPKECGRAGRSRGSYLAATSALALFVCTVSPALADESGVSFWVPGL